MLIIYIKLISESIALLYIIFIHYIRHYFRCFQQVKIDNMTILPIINENTIKIIRDESPLLKYSGLKQDGDIFVKYIQNAISIKSYSNLAKCKSKINLFIEQMPVDTNIMNNCKFNIMMVNSDSFFENISSIKNIDLILCKTKYTYNLLKEYRKSFNRYNYLQLKSEIGDNMIKTNINYTDVSEYYYMINILKFAKLDSTELKYKILYTNFTSDIKIDDIEKTYDIEKIYDIEKTYDKYVHIAGRSPYKNTHLVLKTYINNPHLPHITILCTNNTCTIGLTNDEILNITSNKYKNITFINTFVDNITNYYKFYGIHVCPSSSEGWGHYLNEARAYSNVIITTNHPPMNEMIDNESGVLIDVYNDDYIGSIGAINVRFDISNLCQAIINVENMSIETKRTLGTNAYHKYLKDTEYFKGSMDKLQKYIYENKINELGD